ncbi:Pentatricopeptide repeat - like 10 [Theobroma cacao]|nr:Pentatricopeptide repeat - like 10 [Theobroma cacao]
MVETGVDISVYSLTAVVDGLCKNGDVKKDACAKSWDFEELDLVLGLMEKAGVEFNVETFKFFIDGYTSYGKINEAGRMSNRGVKPNADTYWSLINGYSKVGEMEMAMKYVNEMQKKGFELDKNGLVDEAFELRIEMERKGFHSDMYLCNQMGTLLCEIYQIEKAKMLLNIMIKRGVCPKIVSFTSAIS